MSIPSAGTTSLKELPSMRILLADADKSVHQAYCEPLARENIELVAARNGVECIELLRDHAPDVVVLDSQLRWGGSDGVLAFMHEAPALSSIPVVVLTSCCENDALASLERFPVSDYHSKPLSPLRLAKTLRELHGRRRLHDDFAEETGRLERSIMTRTHGRITNLRVETIAGGVQVRGDSNSYHTRQLALAAVLEAFPALDSKLGKIHLDITVSRPRVRRPIATNSDRRPPTCHEFAEPSFESAPEE